jgi:hypothetical protein
MERSESAFLDFVSLHPGWTLVQTISKPLNRALVEPV